MLLDSLRTSYTYVLFPAFSFFILTFLTLVSLLRGRRNPTNILFAALCLIGALINADGFLVTVLPDKVLALAVDRGLHFFFVFTLAKARSF